MGNLYIVATPIGNMQDITIRAGEVLFSVPYIITESTSKTANLLEYVKNNLPNVSTSQLPKLISYAEDEEDEKLPHVIRLLEENDAALVSEAGTPLISDPGFKLVREAIMRGVKVISIPGASSPIAALTTSGLPTDKFTFLGYLPKKEGKKLEVLKRLMQTKQILSTTMIIFESPHRLIETLKSIKETFGDINIVITRELTKIHEEVRRETVSESIKYFESHAPKGEIIILI